MVYYELKVHGDDLLSLPCEPVDEYGEGPSDGFDTGIFEDRGIFQFFKNMGKGDYEPVWAQDFSY